MTMFKAVATEHLKLLFFIFVLTNGLHAVPANPANSCRSDFYLCLHITQKCLVFESFAAAMLLLAVLMVINNAEADAVTAARAAASARGDADNEAAAVAARGIASVPAGWKRGSLRALLYLAVHFSGVASFHAILAFEDGFLYRTGCHAGYAAGSPFADILMCLTVVVHGFSVWVVKYQN